MLYRQQQREPTNRTGERQLLLYCNYRGIYLSCGVRRHDMPQQAGRHPTARLLRTERVTFFPEEGERKCVTSSTNRSTVNTRYYTTWHTYGVYVCRCVCGVSIRLLFRSHESLRRLCRPAPSPSVLKQLGVPPQDAYGHSPVVTKVPQRHNNDDEKDEGARMRMDNGRCVCPNLIDNWQGLGRGCNLAPLAFDRIFAAALMIAFDQLRKEEEEKEGEEEQEEEAMADMVQVKSMATDGKGRRTPKYWLVQAVKSIIWGIISTPQTTYSRYHYFDCLSVSGGAREGDDVDHRARGGGGWTVGIRSQGIKKSHHMYIYMSRPGWLQG